MTQEKHSRSQAIASLSLVALIVALILLIGRTHHIPFGLGVWLGFVSLWLLILWVSDSVIQDIMTRMEEDL